MMFCNNLRGAIECITYVASPLFWHLANASILQELVQIPRLLASSIPPHILYSPIQCLYDPEKWANNALILKQVAMSSIPYSFLLVYRSA